MSVEYLQLEDLDQLLKHEGDELYTYLHALTGNPDEAGDLLQQCYVRFIEQVKKGKIQKKTAGYYLKKMARNEYNNTFRVGKHEAPLLEDDEKGLADDTSRHEMHRTSEEIRLLFLEALDSDKMPEEHANILRMRFLKNMSLEDMMEATDSSRSTVYRAMEHGLKRLVEVFEEAGLRVEDLQY